MNGTKILAGEYLIALAFLSWAAIKHKYWPWPGAIFKMSVGFAVLGIVGMAAPEVAASLGAGYLLAGFLHIYSNGGLSLYNGGQDYAGGQDGSSLGYDLLTIPLGYTPKPN